MIVGDEPLVIPLGDPGAPSPAYSGAAPVGVVPLTAQTSPALENPVPENPKAWSDWQSPTAEQEAASYDAAASISSRFAKRLVASKVHRERLESLMSATLDPASEAWEQLRVRTEVLVAEASEPATQLGRR